MPILPIQLPRGAAAPPRPGESRGARGGRPAELGARRTRRIVLVLSDDEHAAMSAASDRVPLARWLREIGRDAAGLPPIVTTRDDDPEES